jgi:isoaspartyl peptidase/L-asparaginase-like protein (Ntn-hydrolase superfamily)
MQIVVHGGAGGAPDTPGERQAVLDDAAAAGADAETPLDAVETAVRNLESSPRFNAGYGGALQSDGRVRTDAGLMTDERRIGAVCGMPGVEHAVSAARLVLSETPHVLLAGERAAAFAADFGVETGADLTTEATRERFADADPPEGGPRAQRDWIRSRFGGSDTVGAVARAGDSLAAATSTGGRWFALAGRVGDVPQAGSGFYASPAGSASATGAGEDIARVTLSRRAVEFLEAGADAGAAAERALAEFVDLTDSTAGLIVLGADGSVGEAFNSEAMQTARDGRER